MAPRGSNIRHISETTDQTMVPKIATHAIYQKLQINPWHQEVAT